MSQPQPTQPDQPQYQISVLDLFPVYTTRAAYQQATGQQAPPFDPSQPLKEWADPAPSGQPYLVFDSTAVATGYVGQFTLPAAQAAQLNLPGAYNYTAYVSPPTDAMQYGPFGPIGPASPDQVCLQTDAQEIANQLAPFFPGVTPVVAQENTGLYHYVYGQDPRRQWAITFGNYIFVAQTLIEARNYHGVGSPGHWTWDGQGHLNWVYDQPVIAAPPNAATLPVPIRALLPNEKFLFVLPTSPFQPNGWWVVERTDLPQPAQPESSDQQFADVKAALAAIQTSLGSLCTKLGA